MWSVNADAGMDDLLEAFETAGVVDVDALVDEQAVSVAAITSPLKTTAIHDGRRGDLTASLVTRMMVSPPTGHSDRPIARPTPGDRSGMTLEKCGAARWLNRGRPLPMAGSVGADPALRPSGAWRRRGTDPC